MVITFPKNETERIQIQLIPPRKLSKEYLELRESVWQDKLLQSHKHHKTFWDGVLYSFEGISQSDMGTPVIKLSTIKYSDRIMKQIVGVDEISRRFGEDHYLVHCGVGINVITSDDKFVLGRKMTVAFKKNKWSFPSGNMNADEVPVTHFNDIVKTAMVELAEETLIAPKLDRMIFRQLSLYNSYCNFEFTYQAEFHSRDVNQYFRVNGEFDELACFTKVELLELDCISDLEYSKKYL
ncbi:NUDIX hydrolase [bacterium]|nr:NUDIX hydrolase [bacterium]